MKSLNLKKTFDCDRYLFLQELLECLRRVLTSDHKKHCFNECTDLPRQKQVSKIYFFARQLVSVQGAEL